MPLLRLGRSCCWFVAVQSQRCVSWERRGTARMGGSEATRGELLAMAGQRRQNRRSKIGIRAFATAEDAMGRYHSRTRERHRVSPAESGQEFPIVQSRELLSHRLAVRGIALLRLGRSCCWFVAGQRQRCVNRERRSTARRGGTIAHNVIRRPRWKVSPSSRCDCVSPHWARRINQQPKGLDFSTSSLARTATCIGPNQVLAHRNANGNQVRRRSGKTNPNDRSTVDCR